jgi:hypothetical protein
VGGVVGLVVYAALLLVLRVPEMTAVLDRVRPSRASSPAT